MHRESARTCLSLLLSFCILAPGIHAIAANIQEKAPAAFPASGHIAPDSFKGISVMRIRLDAVENPGTPLIEAPPAKTIDSQVDVRDPRVFIPSEIAEDLTASDEAAPHSTSIGDQGKGRATSTPPISRHSGARRVIAPGTAREDALPARGARRDLAGISEKTKHGSQSRGALNSAFDNAASQPENPEIEGVILPDMPRGIPLSWIETMRRKNKTLDPAVKRLQESVQTSGFEQAALNRGVIAAHNDGYTVAIPQGTMTDQKESGRCWIFAGLNMLRSALLTKGRKLAGDFEFSENYLIFFAMLEKSNRSIERVADLLLEKLAGADIPPVAMRGELIRRLRVDDKGWYDWFQFLVAKYGLVPKNAMRETASSEATESLLRELNNSLAATAEQLLHLRREKSIEAAVTRARRIKAAGMARIWSILTAHFGEPPAKFDFREDAPVQDKKNDKGPRVTPATITRYTPREFAAKFAGFNPDDYVVLTNFPRKKKGGVYQVEDSAIGASVDGKLDRDLRFINVGYKRLEELAAASIQGGIPVWFGADVLKDVDYETGIMHPKIYDRAPIYGFKKSDKNKNLSRNVSAYFLISEPNHAMVLTGYDRPDPKGRIVKFRVENSWGDKAGAAGNFHMYEEWFRDNVYQIVVHKKFLSDEERKAWAGRAQIIDEDEMP